MASPQNSDLASVKPLLEEDEKAFYAGQKQPDDKVESALGVPTCVTGQPVAYTSETGKVNPDNASEPSLEAPTSDWKTGLFCCLNFSADEWAHRDCEICCLGMMAPCVLYGGTSHRLDPSSTFRQGCLTYFTLCAIGKLALHSNALAPLLSFRSRTAMRNQFGIKGHMTKVSESTGCCTNSNFMKSGNVFCDCLLHYLCHRCALCQEARELERQLSKSPALSHITSTAPSAQIMSK